MAYVPFTKVTVGGVFGSASTPVEIWSWGFQFQSFAQASASIKEAVALKIVALHQDPLCKIGSKAFLNTIKFSEVGANGLVVGNPYLIEYATPVPGGGGTSSYPYQVAQVISLRTGERGVSKRGRFYLPSPTSSVDQTTGLISATDKGSVAGAVGQYLYEINQVLATPSPSPGKICVASSKGYNTVVKDVYVGGVLDTQRRRRNALTEDYATYLNINS